MPKKTRELIIASSDWTIPSENGVHRRTLVKGAAWTVPVVAVAAATPAAAASNPSTPTTSVDLAVVSVTWMPQGGSGDVPPLGPDGRSTFNANNGLYYDTVVTNNGPDPVTGVRFNISLSTLGHNVDPNSSLHPFVQNDGFTYTTSYNQDSTNLRTVFVYDNPTLVLAPGQQITIRSLYRTTSAAGVMDDGTYPYASVVALDPNTTDTNPANDGGRSTNAYNVRT